MPTRFRRAHPTWRNTTANDDSGQPFLNFLFDDPVSLDVNVKLSPLAAMIIIMFIIVLITAMITIYKTFNTMYLVNNL